MEKSQTVQDFDEIQKIEDAYEKALRNRVAPIVVHVASCLEDAREFHQLEARDKQAMEDMEVRGTMSS